MKDQNLLDLTDTYDAQGTGNKAAVVLKLIVAVTAIKSKMIQTRDTDVS